jgi:uncharacterized PurR-regulated membrane protein YhhQ (DUF165 family)
LKPPLAPPEPRMVASVCVDWPNCGLVSMLLGLPKFGWLRMLKHSARNCRPNFSVVDVLSAAPRLVLFGTLAMFAGDIANNYVLARMKEWTDGRYISARFVTSTLCGQMVNTTNIFGLWRMIPNRVLTQSIVVATLTTVSVELILLPLTLRICLWLKRMENVDYFDRVTNFNPLKF